MAHLSTHSNRQPRQAGGSWTSMRDAAKQVGIGLPTLYKYLRSSGDFVRVVTTNQTLPSTRLIAEGLFKIEEIPFTLPDTNIQRYSIKVKASATGLIFLQEAADKINQEKRKK